MDTNRTPETTPQPTGQPQPQASHTPPAVPPAPAVGTADTGTGAPAPHPAVAASPKPPVWRRTPVWGTAAALGLLLVGGVGGALLVDELRDDRGWSDSRGGWGDRDDRDDRDDRSDTDDSRGEALSGDAGSTSGSRAATGSDDLPLTDAELAAVTEAALAEADGGTVTDVDRSDDLDHAFSVDVRLANGDELEVDLDAGYAVVRTQLDRADRF